MFIEKQYYLNLDLKIKKFKNFIIKNNNIEGS